MDPRPCVVLEERWGRVRIRIQLTDPGPQQLEGGVPIVWYLLEIQWIDDGSDPFRLSESRFPQIHID